MLESIDDQGNFTWHCDNPKCSHHNCADWQRTCNVHTSPGRQRVSGQTHQHHIRHEGVQWHESGREVFLPRCHCGQAHTVNVGWDEEELLSPIIHRGMLQTVPPREGIVKVELPGSPNLTRITDHLERYIVEGQEVYVRVIDAVEPHPAIARHQELARQLHAIGKTPPTNE